MNRAKKDFFNYFLLLLFLLSIDSNCFGSDIEKEINDAYATVTEDPELALITLMEILENHKRELSLYQIALIHEFSGSAYEELEDYQNAILKYNLATKLYEETDSIHHAVSLIPNIGALNCWLGKYDEAINILIEGIRKAEMFDDKNSLARIYQNVGMVYSDINENELSLNYNQKALEYFQQTQGQESNEAAVMQNMAILYRTEQQYDSAIFMYKKSLKIFTRLGEITNQAILYNNLGVVFEIIEQPDSSIYYYNLALKIFEEIEFQRGSAILYYNIGNILRNTGQFKEALEYFYRSQEIAEEIELKEQIRDNYFGLAVTYDSLNDYYNSLENLYSAYSWRDTVFSIEQSDKIAELETIYQTEQKEQQILLQEAQLRQKSIRNIALTGISLLGLIIAIIIYLNLRSKKKLNNELRTTNKELRHKNKQITNSITYASFIQAAILPPLDLFKDHFPDNFIIFKPKDIVSGDFYWITKNDNKIIIAMADCTGHGVPGAFMSMLGMTFLNEIINIYGEQDPSKILGFLRNRVIDALRQKDKLNDTRDGMDIALCSIDLTNQSLTYSGAYLPVFIASDGKLIKLEANRMPIGYHKTRRGDFMSLSYQLKSNDVVYLYTDGLPDQFGGLNNKKFSRKRLNELLEKNSNLNLKDQEKQIIEHLENWMQNKEQIDDISVIGIRI